MDSVDFNKIFSVSKLDLFDKCPKAFYFTYLDPIYSKMKSKLKKEPENIWPFQTLGKSIHDSLTLFFHSAKEQQTFSDLKEKLKLTWRSEAMANKLPPLGKWGGFKSLDEERDCYKQALEMLVNFFHLIRIILAKSKDDPSVIKFLPTKDLKRSIEDYKKLIKPISEEFDISGKFDLIIKGENNSLEVIDFKTGKSENDNHFQLKFYKLLVELNFNQPVTKASFYYLKTGRVRVFDLTPEDSQETKFLILSKIEKIKEEKKFMPYPSKLCKFCLFKNFCPAKKEIAKFTEKPVQEDLIEDLPF